ncbi:hypothetical protein CTAYLR_005799 [Chrysophaeum taylorii]|uniref:Altered inheritance of mitochondria protein 24, mitochondrial n=1 Tax=Chrysophaeum taylorii TaxID=2483200 RepID=A0AAD7XMG4_9STRA|nr:hypothetical protein CTAYLR_005799 [Chrysophaeum taylorii]
MEAPPPEAEVVGIVGGFEKFVAVVASPKYEILGDDMQVLSIKLDLAEEVTTAPGSLNFMHPGIHSSVDCKDCFGRCMSGERCIMATYKATSPDAYVALASDVPGKVIPVHLGDVDGKIRTKTGAFFASLGDARLTFHFDCNPCTCCFAGQGLLHQVIVGSSSSTAFLSAMGTILTKRLDDGEVLVVDTHSLVAWQDSVKLGIRRTGGCCTCCCAGEGLFNTTLTGPGHIFLQSMSKEKFKAALSVAAANNQRRGGGGSAASGSPLAPDDSYMTYAANSGASAPPDAHYMTYREAP